MLNKQDNTLGRRSADGNQTYAGVKLLYESIAGYSAQLPESIVTDLRRSSEVMIVEADSDVHHCHVAKSGVLKRSPLVQSQSYGTPPVRSKTLSQTVSSSLIAQATQKAARPGLVRISHAHNDARTSDYIYRSAAGNPVTIYSFDSGVRTSHTEFHGRVSLGVNYVSGQPGADTNGHGTHVMAIALGQTYGVARNARGVSVKTLDAHGSGKASVIIQGIDWVLRQSAPNNLKVINLSFAGTYNTALNQAVERAVAAGVHVIVAAGNERQDVRQVSPASSESVLTVGAIDEFDQATNYTNFGALVDFVAPGDSVISAWYRSDTDTKSDTGTSMAAPHVTGMVAYVLGLMGPMSPAQMKTELVRLSGTLATAFPSGTIPRVIYNGSGR